MAKGETHKHDYQKLVLIPCLAQDKPMGILARACECGAKEAFEYGGRNEMKELGISYARAAKLHIERQAGTDKENPTPVSDKDNGKQLRIE